MDICGRRARTCARCAVKVGLVFQYPEYQLFEETVHKDIAFGPRNLGLDDDEIERARARRPAAWWAWTRTCCDKSPFELSGGQKRRVAIAGRAGHGARAC